MPTSSLAIAYSTPLGQAWIAYRGGTVIELGLPGRKLKYPTNGDPGRDVADLLGGLRRYWEGGPLPALSEAMLRVAARTETWGAIYRAVASIPRGSTMTYSAVAQAAGRPGAARAVGAAMAANPFAPVIPCHRVVGSDGSLRGYGGGLDMKRYLLDMEAATADG